MSVRALDLSGAVRYNAAPATDPKKEIGRLLRALKRPHLLGRNPIAQMLVEGEADIAISTEGLDRYADIVTFPCYSWHHVVVVPKDHPLVEVPRVTLDDVAEYPIITYERDFTGRSHIDEAFEKSGRILAVAGESGAVHADYTLECEIRDFDAQYASDNGAPMIVVEIEARLLGPHGTGAAGVVAPGIVLDMTLQLVVSV